MRREYQRGALGRKDLYSRRGVVTGPEGTDQIRWAGHCRNRQQVRSNGGAAGVGGVKIEQFESDLQGNLYEIE